MARDVERQHRAAQGPIVAGLPEAPGISAAMRLTPGLATHLRGLADELLVNDYPGATISREVRELLATTVSASNDCFFCMDSHGAHAEALLGPLTGAEPGLVDDLKRGSVDRLDPKVRALVHIARTVARRALDLGENDVAAATSAGATDADVQLAVLIGAGFSMYNRMVDGFRARTAPEVDAYRGRAAQIAERGYAAPVPLAAAAGPAEPIASAAKGS